MGWFDEQLRQRRQSDDDAFAQAFASMAEVVLGQRLSQTLNDKRVQAKDAIDEILRFYHVPSTEVPESVTDIDDQLEYLLRPSGMMRRTVKLEGAWYKDAVGAMLTARKDDGTPVALIPRKTLGYDFYDASVGRKRHLDKHTALLLSEEAICFYKPLPLRAIGLKDLVLYICSTIELSDVLWVLGASLLASLVGLIMPAINQLIYGQVIVQGSTGLLLAVAGFLLCVTLSRTLLSAAQSLVMERLSGRMNAAVQAAGMMRLLSMPAAFFREYSSGELSSRIGYLDTICSMLTETVLSAGLTSVFSLVYVGQMFHYGPQLVGPGMAVILFTVVFSIISTIASIEHSKRFMEAAAKENGVAYQMITGIQKLKLAGAEKRGFAKWAEAYTQYTKLYYNPPKLIKFSGVIAACITLVGTIVIYFFTIKSGVTLADYYAFNSAFGMVMGAFATLTGTVGTIAQLRPMLEMIEPLMKTAPEVSENKQVVTKLRGGIELSHVSFRYRETSPLILDDLSLKINPGQYVAIVGKTGCGKSTLMRVLLGFEKPQRGSVYYDGKDLAALDLKSLRRSIGTVMQNGKLLNGDIFSNITITAPRMTLEEAWAAAETAGIAEDIRDMPMGMHTLISEGGGGISGGQRQRLLIASAIAPKPRILMFDEATSALDNLTQKQVSEALDKLKCTRIVIAHRLSTIRHCDRIIVLDQGHILEDGTYEELVQANGFFADLVSQQLLDRRESGGDSAE